MNSTVLRTTLLTLLLGVFAADRHPAHAQTPADTESPPAAPIRPVTDSYHGVDIVDPYRWLEDLQSPETQAWIKAQADYADAYLHALPERDASFGELQAPATPGTDIRMLQRRGERWFYLRQAPGADEHVLVMRERADAPERVLVDPASAFDDGKRWSINSYSASPDGRHVAYMVSEGGKEFPDLRHYDIAQGRDTGLRIGPTFATTWLPGRGIAWLPDSSGFFANRQRDDAETVPPEQRRQRARSILHRLGEEADAARTVLEHGSADLGIPMSNEHHAYLMAPAGGDHLIARIGVGTHEYADWYVAPIASLARDAIPWRKVAGEDERITRLSIHDGHLYAMTFTDAPRYKVVRTSLREPDFATAQTVLPAGQRVLQNIVASADALYVQAMDGGLPTVLRLDYDNAALTVLPKAEGSSARLLDDGDDSQRRGAAYVQQTFTSAPSWWHFDAAGNARAAVALAPAIADEREHIQVRLVHVASHDGVAVPVVIMHNRGIALDGSHPALLVGYGAYGAPFLDPTVWPERSMLDAWWTRGFVIAVAGVRGGGEYGKEWHEGGKEATKPNTWKDFIAAADYLVREGYTRPERLAGMGTSAGGITIGNAIAERPELFAAAIIQVGWTNALRIETTANRGNIAEVGSTQTRAGFDALLAMDAYHKLRDGTDYPAVLLTHGFNDPRVDAWFSAKMAARLQAASTSGKPVLLRIDYDAGHGPGSSRSQRNAETADTLAFLLQQLKTDDAPPATQAKRNAPGVAMVPVAGGKHRVWTQKVGNGPVKLLLLHGGPGTGPDYLENFPEHLGEDYTVYFYAHLGTYLSDQPEDPELYTVARMVEEVEEVRSALGLEQFHLYGHSWGLFLGIAYAAKHPEHLKGLILANASIFARGHEQYYQGLIFADIIEQLPDFAEHADAMRYGLLNNFTDPELMGKIMEQAYPVFLRRHIVRLDPESEPMQRTRRNTRSRSEHIAPLFGDTNSTDFEPMLAAIKTPTLLLGSKYDYMPPYDYARMRQVMNEAGNENVSIQIVPNGAHFAMWDDSDNYFAAIRQFITGLEGSP